MDTDDIDKLAETYNSVLSEVLGMYAPLKKKAVTTQPFAQWYALPQLRKKEDKKKCSGDSLVSLFIERFIMKSEPM